MLSTVISMPASVASNAGAGCCRSLFKVSIRNMYFPLPKIKFITVQWLKIILELYHIIPKIYIIYDCTQLQNLTLGGAQLESMVLATSLRKKWGLLLVQEMTSHSHNNCNLQCCSATMTLSEISNLYLSPIWAGTPLYFRHCTFTLDN